jgi:DNA modification methylase
MGMVEFTQSDAEVPQFAAVVKNWSDVFQTEQLLTPVDFRSLAPKFSARDRFTHLLHPYPAKLIPEIPHLFLRSGLIRKSKGRARIADPFCGSGTVLLEAALAGYDAVGADSNPLARLISRVKTTPLEIGRIKRALLNISRCSLTIKGAEPPPVVNLHYWYSDRIIEGLSKLRASIARLRTEEIREFMKVCLSVCARRLSYADPRLSVPVKIHRSRKAQYGNCFLQLNNHLKFLQSVDVLSYFEGVVLQNCERLSSLNEVLRHRPHITLLEDALDLKNEIASNSVDLVITSPPYLGAQKYIRASGLSLGWTDLAYADELRALEVRTLGREHFSRKEIGKAKKSGIEEADRLLLSVATDNPLRAHIAWTYLQEMEQAIRSISNILRQDAYALIVVGPNTICGRNFDTPHFIECLAQRAGLASQFKLLDHIKSRGLMTKRNRTAGLIANEVVLCLRKVS